MFTIEEIDSIIEKAIFNLEFENEPKELYAPIEYLFSIGGKRLRPKVAILTYNLYCEKIERPIIYPALGLEIFHGFTLIHDDIMDRASMRRGRETVHKKWNENIAILSGDVMCIKAYEYMANAPANKLKEVLDIFSQTAAQVCEGQQYDMNFESMHFITMDDYINMIGLKTAVLIAASAKIGALIAGASIQHCNAIYNYAYNLGLAFQIKDDYFDSFGDSVVFGKKVGGDILCGKKTWLLVEALKSLDVKGRVQLLSVLKDNQMDEKEKISQVLGVYNSLDIKEKAEYAMESYHLKALEALKECDFTKEQQKRLHDFAYIMVNRDK